MSVSRSQRVALSLAAALAVASPGLAQNVPMTRGYTVGPKPAGMTYPKDSTWTLVAPFERLNANRYVLVGYPLWDWPQGAKAPNRKAWPVLDLQSASVLFPTVTLTEDLPRTSNLVHYDPDRQQGGFVGRPQAAGSGTAYHYYHWNLATNQVDWSQPLAVLPDGETFAALGTSPDERYFYFTTFPLNRNTDPDRDQTLARLDLSTGAIDWEMSIPLPRRQGHPLRSPDVTPSADYTKFALIEHSEPADGKVSPPPQAIIVDALSKTSFAVPIPMTPYGIAFDRQNRYLAIGSNVNAKVYRYNLQTKRQEAFVSSLGRIHHVAVSPDNKRLYVFPKGSSIDVRAWPSLNRLQTLPMPVVAKGQSFVDAESMVTTLDGRIGVLPRTAPPYGFPDGKGFFTIKL